MGFLRAFTTPWWYSAWFLASAGGLAIANYLDPYVLAFATMAAVWITIALAVAGLLASFVAGREHGYARALAVLAYAALAALPTLVSVWLLSRIHWA